MQSLSCGWVFRGGLQIGFFGLLRAVKYYDPEKGHAFSSYLPLNISGAIRTELKIKHNKELPPTTASLYEQIAGDGSPIYIVDALADSEASRDMGQVEDGIYLFQLREALRPGLDSLDERGRKYLSAKFVSGKSYAEIGRKYGVTRQAVQDKEKRCLNKFQSSKYLQRLRPFLYP